ncbi:MAG: c-type cytochrome [Neomegalonema sp.]|nr:c-type cytochrome [Neomegalonema sp.]
MTTFALAERAVGARRELVRPHGRRLALDAAKLMCLAVGAALALGAIADEAWAQRTRPRGDVARGQELFRVCAPCHDVGPRARHKTGPGFNRIIGKRIGAYKGYRSSVSMIYFGVAGEVWTVERLIKYMRNPEKFSVGQLPVARSSTSPFIGVFDAKDRADIAAYIAANGRVKTKK